MSHKEKIKEINSKRKPSKGFTEDVFNSISIKAVEVIKRNHFLAKLNVKSIYSIMRHVSTSYSSDLHFYYTDFVDDKLQKDGCRE